MGTSGRDGLETLGAELELRGIWQARDDRYSEQRARLIRDGREIQKMEMYYIGG